MDNSNQSTQHTPTPFRVGDAGLTVFGPPNGNPSPVTVASCLKKGDAAFIKRACNNHARLMKALEQFTEGDGMNMSDDNLEFCIAEARAVLKLAKEGR